MRFGIFVSFFLLGVSAASCSSPEQCSPLSAGSGFNSCGSIQACCTDTSCRYKSSSGREWDCNATDCTSAAMRLVQDCQ